jgi:hypothetical protein
MEHPAVVEVLKTIYTGNRPTKWATPQGRDMMSHFYPLMPEATMAFALTIVSLNISSDLIVLVVEFII